MGREELTRRILDDAQAEADAIVKEAEEGANARLAAASERAEAQRIEAERELASRVASIRAGKEAAARLDGQKVALAQKRRVIDTVYERAFEALLALGQEQTLAFTESLLKQYAAQGDEIVFARDYPCAQEAALLPVVKQRALTVSQERAPFSGGLLLRGKQSDTDLSYRALLLEDREQNQAALAQALFQKR